MATPISYLITCSNETKTLYNLLKRVFENVLDEDEIVILMDSGCKNNDETKNIIDKYLHDYSNIKCLSHDLDKNYSEHKNTGALNCKHNWVLQLDGDECPTETLLLNIKDIIELNSGIECFWIPRVNNFVGVYDKIARQWGWRLTPSESIVNERVMDIDSDEYLFLKNNCYITEENPHQVYLIDGKRLNTIKYKAVLVNFPDSQCRLFRNMPDRIKWVGRLHERIEGNKNYVYLPFDEDLSIYHDKTIETQIATNLRYNTLFTEKENQGFTLPK